MLSRSCGLVVWARYARWCGVERTSTDFNGVERSFSVFCLNKTEDFVIQFFMRLCRRRRATNFFLIKSLTKIKTVCSLFKPPRFAMEAPFDVSNPQSLSKD